MRRTLLLALLITASAHAQWDLQHSGTTADLRGVASVGKGIAWASGSNGTVLRTEDGGYLWQRCTVPPDADKLDFRGIQAFDANTAIVMSSGKGDLSRLYKTTDGCQTWKLVFTNPDADGFWDAISGTPHDSFVIGDPVDSKFVIYRSNDGALEKWSRFGEKMDISHFPYQPAENEALFAASNSVIDVIPNIPVHNLAFVTGGQHGARFYLDLWNEKVQPGHIGGGDFEADLPLTRGPSAGAFSIGGAGDIRTGRHYVVVGGDYTKAADSAGTAAYSTDGGKQFKPAKVPPHGYRSAVAYDAATKTWITVGPNGTDISTDDGRNWRALKPSPTDVPDADQHWNALSLPFVVGPHGRIGLLNPAALKSK